MSIVLSVGKPWCKESLALERVVGTGCRGGWVVVLAKDADKDDRVGIG